MGLKGSFERSEITCYTDYNLNRHILNGLSLTNSPIPEITARELEYIILVAIIREVVRLYLNGELLHKGTRVAGLCVRIRVPGLLFRGECTLWQQTLNPARQMTSDMVNLPRVSDRKSSQLHKLITFISIE